MKYPLVAVITYKGDIYEKLAISDCPRRRVGKNTEQEIEVIRGGGFCGSLNELAIMTEPFLRDECTKNGEVLEFKWCMAEK